MKVAYLALSESVDEENAGLIHTTNIATEIAREKNTVYLFLKKSKKKLQLKEKNLHVFYIDKNKPLNAIKKIRQLLKKVEIIHERFSVNPLSAITYVGLNKPILLEMNDPGIETWKGTKKILYKPLIKSKISLSSAILTQTETLKRIISKHTKKKIYVVPNGSNTKIFDSISKTTVKKTRKKMKAEKKTIITMVSSFREWHGTEDLTKIAKKTIQKNENVLFLIIGKGKNYQKFKNKIKKEKLQKYFKLTGNLKYKNMAEYLKASDICIAPFNLENFPNLKKYGFWWNPIKLFEYIAAGKPIISYNFPEIKKIVQNSGLLAKPGNLNDFSNQLNKIISNKKLKENLSKNAKKLSKKNSWNTRAKEIIKIYKKIRVIK